MANSGMRNSPLLIHDAQKGNGMTKVAVKDLSRLDWLANYKTIEPSFFSRLSSTYYYENYHSEIIAFLLRAHPSNLAMFLNYIAAESRIPMDIEDFKEYQVVREQGRVDIAVRSARSKKVLLIENKSNEAGDQDRQLPRYYEYYENADYQPVALMYINLRSLKEPAKVSWSTSDIHKLRKSTFVTRLYGSTHSLCSGWLQAIVNGAQDADSVFVAKHFIRLVDSIVCGGGNMEKLEEFHRYLVSKGGFEQIRGIRKAIDEYPLYIVKLMEEQLQEACLAPFKPPYSYDGNTVVIDFSVKEKDFAIQIFCTFDDILVTLFQRNGSLSNVAKLLAKTGTSDLLPDVPDEYSDRRSCWISNPKGITRAPIIVETFMKKVAQLTATKAISRKSN